MPPYVAGRQGEADEFRHLLRQSVILDNLIITGLRGTGKTVLLERLKPIAMESGWLWIGEDLSESASVSEERLATRFLVDLGVITSGIETTESIPGMGFGSRPKETSSRIDHDFLRSFYDKTPGLASDKLKGVLEFAWRCLRQCDDYKGVIFVYDEAQNLSNKNASKKEYPLSLMLDVFVSIQKKGIPFMLVLSGLPVLFPMLVDARTFAERMFRVITLRPLNEQDSREAITVPIEEAGKPFKLWEAEIKKIIELSGGYPYFIQFIGREVFDISVRKIVDESKKRSVIPFDSIIRKLDTDFYAGRWAKTTDRQRELLTLIARLENCNDEFSVQQILEQSRKESGVPFSPSTVNQLLAKSIEHGLMFKRRHGVYAFAVPLLGEYIRRWGNTPES